MPDTANLSVLIGTWMDEAEGKRLPILAEAQLASGKEVTAEEFISRIVSGLRDGEINPWAHDFQIRSFYAGVSAEHWNLVANVAPHVDHLLGDEALRVLASAFLGAIFGKLLGIPSWFMGRSEDIVLAEASEQVRQYMVQRDDIAPSDVQELSAEQLEDGAYRLLVRRTTDGHEFLCLVSPAGEVVARLDISELRSYVEKEVHAARERESDDR